MQTGQPPMVPNASGSSTAKWKIPLFILQVLSPRYCLVLRCKSVAAGFYGPEIITWRQHLRHWVFPLLCVTARYGIPCARSRPPYHAPGKFFRTHLANRSQGFNRAFHARPHQAFWRIIRQDGRGWTLHQVFRVPSVIRQNHPGFWQRIPGRYW